MRINSISSTNNYKQIPFTTIPSDDRVLLTQNQDASQFKSNLKFAREAEIAQSNPFKAFMSKLNKALKTFFKPTFNPEGPDPDFSDIDLYSRIFM
ncbi:MAG: hypothetical protein WCY19_05205 [Candidatus Gastranaerophilaceae bacterium]